ncbi:Mom family adenine methylcarbamoylation protein [Kribbella sp. CA-293567]|uniref:Mom family adenine methylcarbamoylation protein n=1 Tax=Kribbella sp. CA-293567 TaxID=3002436 RepID=UPI0022DE4062|nr:hypothetical protein [Kribbella sp. CA-293567]WBQ02296.1 hypothetical protein OX958_20135 [Kribbella sp. CA-293567]
MLHLPRVAGRDGQLILRQLNAELRNCAVDLRADHAEVQDLLPLDGYALQDLRFVSYDDVGAARIFGRLHYLRSARRGSRSYALVDPRHGLPVTLCSVSPLDWGRVGRQLSKQFGVPADRAWDVSRVYSFDVAPGNAISYLLGKVRKSLHQAEPDAELLTTAVDPNLGFTGSSYRAANWQRWMTISPRPYIYLDRRYISPRKLREDYDTANVSMVRALSGAVVEQSRVKLLDSAIFCSRLKGETESVPLDEQRRLRR